MRAGWAALVVAGCAETAAGPDPAVVRAGQERVCAEVVAGHVGPPVGRVDAAWQSAGADGFDVVAVRHGGTFHTCEVDEALRVRALQHPEA